MWQEHKYVFLNFHYKIYVILYPVLRSCPLSLAVLCALRSKPCIHPQLWRVSFRARVDHTTDRRLYPCLDWRIWCCSGGVYSQISNIFGILINFSRVTDKIRPRFGRSYRCSQQQQKRSLQYLLAYYYNNNNNMGYLWYWDLTSSPQDRLWFWSDGSEFDYQNWAKGEPNNSGGREPCIVINWGGTVGPVSFTDPFIK